MNNMNSGYTGYSMSNRAMQAYENGEKPYSKWTRGDLIDEIVDYVKACEVDVDVELLNKLSVKILKEVFLYRSSWHHTSSHVVRTEFYSIDYDKVGELDNEWIADLIKIDDEEKAERAKRKAQKELGEQWECAYLVWSGTKAHPKATECVSVGTIKGNWFYLENGAKKSIAANGFRKLKKVV